MERGDAPSALAFVGTRGYVSPSNASDGEASREIHAFGLDPETGELSRRAVVDAGENPSFLAVHPDEARLYAVSQADEGTVTGFEFDPETGELSRLNRRRTGDARPCHVSVDPTGRYALATHYVGGSVSVLPIAESGRLSNPSHAVEREGRGPDPDRQTRSRPHAAVFGPDDRFVYVPDLGADRVWVYELDRDEGRLVPAGPGSVRLHAGAGPRHLAFHPDGRFAYAVNELDSTLTAFERDPRTGDLSAVRTVSTLPTSFEGENRPADVHVHPSGRWVYGSNRGHDSVAVFAVDSESGAPEPAGHASTGGEWPRNFALDPTGEYLFAENQATDGIVPFRVDDAAGGLSVAGPAVAVRRPSCMALVPVGTAR